MMCFLFRFHLDEHTEGSAGGGGGHHSRPDSRSVLMLLPQQRPGVMLFYVLHKVLEEQIVIHFQPASPLSPHRRTWC